MPAGFMSELMTFGLGGEDVSRVSEPPADTGVDSSNWTVLFDTTELQCIYAMHGTLTVTFTPPIPCNIDTSSRPADAIAVPVRAIAKKNIKKRGGAASAWGLPRQCTKHLVASRSFYERTGESSIRVVTRE